MKEKTFLWFMKGMDIRMYYGLIYGCFYYICGKKEWFYFYKECDGKYVILFNSGEVKIDDVGYVNVKF